MAHADAGLTDEQAAYLETLIATGRIVYDGAVEHDALPTLFCPFCSKAAPPWASTCPSCTRPLHPKSTAP